MLIIKKLLVAVLVASAVISLSSCKMGEERIDVDYSQEADANNKDTDKENDNADVSGESGEKSPAEKALEELNTLPEYPEGYPELSDVVAQYRKACEAIGWIVGTELVATDGDYGYEANGMKYYKVLPDCYLGSARAGDDPDAKQLIYNKETLEAYFATLIGVEDAREYTLDIDQSFDIPRFVENENGELYALPYAFPPAGYADDKTDEFGLHKNDDGSYTLEVRYYTLDDEDNIEPEYHTYNVKYVNENGRWVFRNFRLVKQH